jgi:hypothetical protein
MGNSTIWLALLVVATTVLHPARAADSAGHPDSSGWKDLIAPDLSNAVFPAGVWTVKDGEFTASKDECIWTKEQYTNCVIDLEFKNDVGTNSGVFVYCSNIKNSVPNSVEVQIADDFLAKRAKMSPTSRCGAFFGHQAPSAIAVHKPGQWNRMTITCKGPMISVVLNGQAINQIDLRRWTSAKKNPDGSDIPPWLSRAWAELPTCGHIGLQGKHHGAAVYFRNLKIKPE